MLKFSETLKFVSVKLFLYLRLIALKKNVIIIDLFRSYQVIDFIIKNIYFLHYDFIFIDKNALYINEKERENVKIV